MRDFLAEIHTEELPPKNLTLLATSFLQSIEAQLTQAGLHYDTADYFATPRRLAVIVKNLAEKQPNSVIERKGPARQAAFDSAGNPTPACQGFAKSCGITTNDLITIKTDQGEWVGYKQTMKGKKVDALLPGIIEKAITSLPIAKRMRWGNHSVEFVRPVHSIIMLYGNKKIPAPLLGLTADRKTQGHRFHSKGWLSIANPAAYSSTLEKAYVIADFSKRKQKILEETQHLVRTTLGNQAKAVIPDELLDEVTGLVEWPVAMLGEFDKTFLTVPQEALISAMQDHQRYFPITDHHGQLLPHFITISNIASLHPAHVIAGNERVLRARLSDAAFFYATDKKMTLQDRVESLKTMVFQQKLGSLFDKTQRVARLAATMANAMHVDTAMATLAATLAKADLTSQLVNEFPELQGIAGYYYALHEKQPKEVALALKEQYFPRFSGDQLASSLLGSILAIADRMDTLVGVFGMQQAPTGDKDPFGLRRAALGILRTFIENKIQLDLYALIQFAADGFTQALDNKAVVDQVWQFMLERLKPWYQEQQIAPDVIAAVNALAITQPYDIHRRIQAVQHFKRQPEAEALSIANKRVSNLLAKYESAIVAKTIDPSLFEHAVEKQLAEAIAAQQKTILSLSQAGNYGDVLTNLAQLREPVDKYFDGVLIMTDNERVRDNRLLLLKQLRDLFLHVADIALLQ